MSAAESWLAASASVVGGRPEIGVGGCFYSRGQDGDAAAEFELVGVVGDKQSEVNGLLYVGEALGTTKTWFGGWHLPRRPRGMGTGTAFSQRSRRSSG